MRDVFIPPEGALQFELTDFPGEGVWVGPNKAAFHVNRHCSCKEGYPIVAWGPFEPVKGMGDPTHGTAMVCGCMGRIIE